MDKSPESKRVHGKKLEVQLKPHCCGLETHLLAHDTVRTLPLAALKLVCSTWGVIRQVITGNILTEHIYTFFNVFFPLKNLTIRVLVVALGLPPVVREETWLPMALGGSLTCHVKLYRLKIYVTVFRTEWSYNLVLIQEILFIHFNLKKS